MGGGRGGGLEEEKGELGETPKRGGEWILDHWGSTHHVYWTTAPPPTRWDRGMVCIKTTPQHAKKTLVAAGRMPVRGKRIHRLGSKRRIEEEEKNLARQDLWNCPFSETPASARATRMGRKSVHRGGKKNKEKKKEYPGEGRKPQTSAKCAYAVAARCHESVPSSHTHPQFASTLSDSLALDAEFLDR